MIRIVFLYCQRLVYLCSHLIFQNANITVLQIRETFGIIVLGKICRLEIDLRSAIVMLEFDIILSTSRHSLEPRGSREYKRSFCILDFYPRF